MNVKTFYVYIMASMSGTLYVGMTNSAFFRTIEHREGRNPGSFTSRYKVDRLLYYEMFAYVHNAIAREKEIKGWRRARKIELIDRRIRNGGISGKTSDSNTNRMPKQSRNVRPQEHNPIRPDCRVIGILRPKAGSG